MAYYRLFKEWITLSIRYPADKFIHGLVGSINFYPPDNNNNKNKKKPKWPLDSYIFCGVTFPSNQRRRKTRIFRRQLDPL